VEGGSANDYDYVAGDPVNSFDLDGQICFKCHIRNGKRFLKKHSKIMHRVINIGVGVAAGVGAAAFCAGTAGAGCVILAGAAIGAGLGTAAHVGAARLVGERVTAGKAMGWIGSSAAAGATGGVWRAAWGRGLLTGGPLRMKAGHPGLRGLGRQPFWGSAARSRYGGRHGGLRW
jgi:hypothetical protein